MGQTRHIERASITSALALKADIWFATQYPATGPLADILRVPQRDCEYVNRRLAARIGSGLIVRAGGPRMLGSSEVQGALAGNAAAK